MKHTHTQRKLFALTTLALSLCGAVLLTLCYLTAYDSAIGYFKKDAILPILTTALALLFTAGILGDAILLHRKSDAPLAVADPLWHRVVSALVGVGFLAVTLVDMMAEAPLLTLLAGLLSGAHFLLRALKPKSYLPLTLTGIGVIARLTLAIGQLYFNGAITMNAPVKVYLQLGCVAGMCFLLRDVKATVNPIRSFLTPMALGLGTFLLTLASLPTLVAESLGRMDSLDVSPVPLLLLLLWLYALSRMLTLFVTPKSGEEESTEEAPTEEAPTEEAPTEEAPAEETPNEEEPTAEESETSSADPS